MEEAVHLQESAAQELGGRYLMDHRAEIWVVPTGVGHHSPIFQPQSLGRRAGIRIFTMLDPAAGVARQIRMGLKTTANDLEGLDETQLPLQNHVFRYIRHRGQSITSSLPRDLSVLAKRFVLQPIGPRPKAETRNPSRIQYFANHPEVEIVRLKMLGWRQTRPREQNAGSLFGPCQPRGPE